MVELQFACWSVDSGKLSVRDIVCSVRGVAESGRAGVLYSV